MLFLLRLLAKSYKPLVQTLLMGKKTLNLKDMTNVLLENNRLLESKSSDGTSEVLARESSSPRMTISERTFIVEK